MTIRQTTAGTSALIAVTLNTPTRGRAEAPQGRSQAEAAAWPRPRGAHPRGRHHAGVRRYCSSAF
jgi:hypothetical protein